VGEFRTQFGEESQCAEQLTRQRWPEGFRCPRCSGATRGYVASRRVHECKQCVYQCSVTAGTIFHKTRTPLASWFWAIYRMSHDKKGISAVQLAKEIGVRYRTAWTMQHKIRRIALKAQSESLISTQSKRPSSPHVCGGWMQRR